VNHSAEQIEATTRDGAPAGGLHLRRSCPSASVAGVALLCLSCVLLAAGQSRVEEYRLKAAFLFHFAQFIEWPAGAFPDGADQPLVFCVIGDDPFQGDLEGTVQGKSVAGRTVEVRHIARIQPNSGCHMAFINRKESGRAHELLASLEGAPVLTVGESEEFLRQGGMIRFCMDERKVRFEINQGAAERAHLKISARLLLLAKSVIG